MFDKFFDGFCPECRLKDRIVVMILNGDYRYRREPEEIPAGRSGILMSGRKHEIQY